MCVVAPSSFLWEVRGGSTVSLLCIVGPVSSLGVAWACFDHLLFWRQVLMCVCVTETWVREEPGMSVELPLGVCSLLGCS